MNSMASNLTAQVRNISEVTIAVANGDLSKKITVDVRGEILQVKEEKGSEGEVARGQARRSGDRARRGRHVEGPHGQRNSMASNLRIRSQHCEVTAWGVMVR